MQRAYRGHSGRRRAKRTRDENRAGRARSANEVESVRRRLEELEAAKTLQRAYRGHSGRRLAEASRNIHVRENLS